MAINLTQKFTHLQNYCHLIYPTRLNNLVNKKILAVTFSTSTIKQLIWRFTKDWNWRQISHINMFLQKLQTWKFLGVFEFGNATTIKLTWWKILGNYSGFHINIIGARKMNWKKHLRHFHSKRSSVVAPKFLHSFIRHKSKGSLPNFIDNMVKPVYSVHLRFLKKMFAITRCQPIDVSR